MDTEKFLNDFTEAYKKLQDEIPYNFNVLDEQCGHIVENSHTNILMKILQYRNQYGYVFLNQFFAYFGWDISIREGDVNFEREAYYKGINSESGRIDGLIFQKDHFAVIIENKVNGAGNQEEQLKKYIEGVLGDTDKYGIFPNTDKEERANNIWVVFLTKDGYEKPDDESKGYMMYHQICDSLIDDELSGPRYAAINYRDHILPWIKEVIQPCVMQKEQALNTGLLQYIDFLEGMLGLRKSEVNMMMNCKAVVKERYLNSPTIDVDYFNNLVRLNQYIQKHQNDIPKKEWYDSSNILVNILKELYDEPMNDFFNITKDYFTKELGMKDCIISHPAFNYPYIQIRDASWPKSVHFEWRINGIDTLLGNNKKTLCFHVENEKQIEAFEADSVFFTQSEIVNKKASGAEIKITETTTPMMNMDYASLNTLLKIIYGNINSDFMDAINLELSKR